MFECFTYNMFTLIFKLINSQWYIQIVHARQLAYITNPRREVICPGQLQASHVNTKNADCLYTFIKKCVNIFCHCNSEKPILLYFGRKQGYISPNYGKHIFESRLSIWILHVMANYKRHNLIP